MKRPQRVIVVINCGTQVGAMGRLARTVVAAMAGNAYFPAPVPALSTVTTQADALDEAQIGVRSRTVGARSARDACELRVKASLEQLRTYVQTVVDEHSAADGRAIAQSAGFDARLGRSYMKPAFAARRGPVAGSVDLVAKSVGRRASYQWQHSTDGSTWVSSPETVIASTRIFGLVVGNTCGFRFRTVTRAGVSDWSDVVSHVVT